MDSTGRPYSQIRYRGGGPEAFMKILEENADAKAKRDEMFAAAAKLEGKAKADAIQKALETIGVAPALYPAQLKSLLQADPNSIFGLSAQANGAMSEASDLESANKAFAMYDKVLDKKGLKGEPKQQALTDKINILLGLGEFDAAGELVDSIIKVAPDSRLSKNLTSFKEKRLPKMKERAATEEAKEEAEKVKAEAEKAKEAVKEKQPEKAESK